MADMPGRYVVFHPDNGLLVGVDKWTGKGGKAELVPAFDLPHARAVADRTGKEGTELKLVVPDVPGYRCTQAALERAGLKPDGSPIKDATPPVAVHETQVAPAEPADADDAKKHPKKAVKA